MPTFDGKYYSAETKVVHKCQFLIIIGTVENGLLLRRQCCTSALLRVSTSVPKKCYSTKPIFYDFRALLNFLFSGVKVVLGASGGWYYSAEPKVVH